MRVAVRLPLQHWYISLPQLLQIAGFSYRCVISSTGIELMATVDANSSVTCQLPVSGIAISEAERVARVELQWRNGTNTFDIETSSMEQQSECCVESSGWNGVPDVTCDIDHTWNKSKTTLLVLDSPC